MSHFEQTIRLTPELIALGRREDCRGCPLALAVARLVGPGRFVSAWADRVQVDGHSCRTSPALRAWVLAFDQGGPVEPFEGVLYVPERAAGLFVEGR